MFFRHEDQGPLPGDSVILVDRTEHRIEALEFDQVFAHDHWRDSGDFDRLPDGRWVHKDIVGNYERG